MFPKDLGLSAVPSQTGALEVLYNQAAKSPPSTKAEPWDCSKMMAGVPPNLASPQEGLHSDTGRGTPEFSAMEPGRGQGALSGHSDRRKQAGRAPVGSAVEGGPKHSWKLRFPHGAWLRAHPPYPGSHPSPTKASLQRSWGLQVPAGSLNRT